MSARRRMKTQLPDPKPNPVGSLSSLKREKSGESETRKSGCDWEFDLRSAKTALGCDSAWGGPWLGLFIYLYVRVDDGDAWAGNG